MQGRTQRNLIRSTDPLHRRLRQARTMPTATLPRLESRSTAPRRAPRSPAAIALRVLLRVLTVLVGLATAAITLGPRDLVVGGRSFATDWLTHHPTIAAWVASEGGVEPAGNLLLFVPFASLLALSVGFRLLPVAFLLLLASPVAVEWTQQYLPGRVPDGGDIVRNTAGLLVGFAVFALLRVAVHVARWAVRR
jgi:xanthosine utilization system XapX-like protein